MAQTGIVYLIGAGPGDPGLITVRGRDLLSSCDVVVYDNLIPAELIMALPEQVTKIYVGKRSSAHTMAQHEINQTLVDLASDGHTVARLKGSDPLIFGRGGEEADYLKQHGIPFEIVPGIPAAIGAAAYSGMPCTDRKLASNVTFVTGHKAADKEASSVPWSELAQLKTGTLVIYMGVSQLSDTVTELLNEGMDPNTPAGIVERATTPSQRVITATLEELPDAALANNVKPPALFFVGQTVTLKDKLEWFGKRPLHGRRVMVLRPADQAATAYRSLRELGAEVLPYPTIATRDVFEQVEWDDFHRLTPDQDWLLFTSENGVRYFMERFAAWGQDIRSLARFQIAAVGFGTARALSRYSLKPDFVPTKATVAELGMQLADRHDLAGSTVVRVQGNLSDNTIPDAMTKAGATVLPLTVYETYHPVWPDGLKERLLEFPPDVIMFSSGSTVNGFLAMLTSEELTTVTGQAKVASIGPMTSKTIQAKDLPVDIEAQEHSIPGLIDAILRHFLGERKS